MKVVDVPRRPKRVKSTESDDSSSRLTAYCLGCRLTTGMLRAKRSVSNGVAITVGKCVECKRETFRVGAAKEGAE